jgi:hypothetical protein
MPADTFTISLPGPLADHVRAAAEARGLTPEEYIRMLAVEGVATDAEAAELDWDEDVRRLEEPGEDVDLDTAFAEFRENIAKARRGEL